jgi:hypothetical protein
LLLFFSPPFSADERKLDVNTARERMELREKLRTAKTSPSGMHFVVSCGVEPIFSPSCSSHAVKKGSKMLNEILIRASVGSDDGGEEMGLDRLS